MDSLPPTILTSTTTDSERSTRSVTFGSGAAISTTVRNHIRAILSAALLSGCVTSVLAASPSAAFPGAEADSNPKIVLVDIKPQAWVDAFNEWAQQTGLQVLIPDIRGDSNAMLSPRVKGRLTPQAALDRLVAGTTLTYEYINARTVVIHENDRINEPVLQSDHDVYGAAFGEGEKEPAQDAKSFNDTLFASLQVDEIVVAGTHIRGVVSAGSRVQLLSNTDIDATGYTTIQDVLQSIPANLGGGPSEDFDGGSTAGNFNQGTSINLRGLGADATLVLVNGRRQAASGGSGSFVDVSSIPASAVSRIEVVTDGASAVYGSDAVGGVVNIVLRDDFQGAESRARFGIAGGSRERLFSQIIGNTWDAGNAVLGYQYFDREALQRTDRAYTANDDKRNLGGDDFRLFVSNPGNILNPFTNLPAYALPAGQDGSSLQPSDLLPGVINLQGLYDGADLLPTQRMHSAFFSAHQHVGERLTLSADGRYSRREVEQRFIGLPLILAVPASNPYYVNPFAGVPVVFVAYNSLDDLGHTMRAGHTDTFSGTADATLNFAGGWYAHLTATHAEERLQWQATNVLNAAALIVALADPDPATAFNPFGDGSNTNPATLNAIRSTQHESATSTLDNLSLTADGTVFIAPGGPAKVALGVDYREEGLKSRFTNSHRLDRSVLAGFAELAVPIVAASNARPGVHGLELSLASRYEEYSDFGSSVNPRIGVTWAPFNTVKVRGNWGTSFRAPNLVDISEVGIISSVVLQTIADPASATGQSTVLMRSGGNADLTQETATVWSAGLDFLLPSEASPTLSLTYYDIDFRGRIAGGGPPGAPGNVLLQESQWSELIQRAPSQQAQDALCYSRQFQGNSAICSSTPIAAIVDLRRRNLAEVRVQGIDLSFLRPVSTHWGTFSFGLDGNYVMHYERAASKNSGLQDINDTVGNPLALRMRGTLSWERDEWSANMFINHIGGYVDDLSRPHRAVTSWTSFDFRLAYQTPARAEWFGNVEVSLNATNAFDKDPPFVNNPSGYDPANFDPMGRMLSARVTKWW